MEQATFAVQLSYPIMYGEFLKNPHTYAPKDPPFLKAWNHAFLIRRISDGINPPSGPPIKKFLEFLFSGLEPPYRSTKFKSVLKEYGGKGGATFKEICPRLDFCRNRTPINIVKRVGNQSWC